MVDAKQERIDGGPLEAEGNALQDWRRHRGNVVRNVADVAGSPRAALTDYWAAAPLFAKHSASSSVGVQPHAPSACFSHAAAW